MRRKNTSETPPGKPEEIIIHGLWETPHRFKANGKTVADAIPSGRNLIAMYPGIIAPGEPLKKFATIHKNAILIFEFSRDGENAASVETGYIPGYWAKMNLTPTPEELYKIGFQFLICANLGLGNQ